MQATKCGWGASRGGSHQSLHGIPRLHNVRILGLSSHTHTHTPPHQPCLSSHIECSDTSAVCCYLHFPEPCFSIIDPDHPIGKATDEQTAPETQAQARCTTGVGERAGKVTLYCCRLFLVSSISYSVYSYMEVTLPFRFHVSL